VPEEAFARAVERLRGGDYAAALAALDEVLAQTPDDPAALAYAGIAHFHLKDVQTAQSLLDRAVALGPKDFLAWSKRGELWFLLGCLPQAAADLRRALTLDPPTPASRKWVAKLLEEAAQRSRTSYTRTLAFPRLPLGVSVPTGSWATSVGALFRRLSRGAHIEPRTQVEAA
jgi:predicted Zn-dependent protease